MKRRGLQSNRRGSGVAAKLLTFCAALLILTVLLDMRLRPMVEDTLTYQAHSNAMHTMNTAMMREIQRDDVGYDDIVRLTGADDGIVTSIQTDIAAVNGLKARMTDAVIQSLASEENSTVTVPLGTLLGNQFTAGRGPALEVRLIPLDYVQSELYNQFDSAGINQTRHQIMLRTTVQVAAVLPGYTVKSSVSTDFCVAETIIVGKVPEGYTIVGEDDSSTISKINDYKAAS